VLAGPRSGRALPRKGDERKENRDEGEDMRKVQLILMVTAFVAAMTAVVTGSAQADEYVVEGSPLTHSEAFIVPATRGTYLLHAKPLGTNMTITCEKVSASGSLKEAGASEARFSYSECEITEVTGCAFPEPLIASVNDELVDAKGAIEDEFIPPGGEKGVFTEFTLTEKPGEKCSIKGVYKVTGTQTCSLSNPEREEAEHELSCSVTGSDLTFGGRAATYASTPISIELESKRKWAAKA
jgi:hypothetical protein